MSVSPALSADAKAILGTSFARTQAPGRLPSVRPKQVEELPGYRRHFGGYFDHTAGAFLLFPCREERAFGRGGSSLRRQHVSALIRSRPERRASVISTGCRQEIRHGLAGQ